MMSRRRPIRLAAIATLALISCRRAPDVARSPTESGPKSNVARSDYVGSARCAGCHGKIAAEYASAPMHRMTRLPTPDAITAPFDGRTFRYKNDELTLLADGDERFMHVTSKQFGDKSYRVTRVIGGHHREDFAGVEVVEAKAKSAKVGDGHDELILPVSWVYAIGAYRYKGYSVMSKERPGLRAGGVWNRTCVFCHNTVPYLSVSLGALTHAAGGRPVGFQGEVVDEHLPPQLRWPFEITDGHALSDALGAELSHLGSREPPAGDLVKRLEQTVRVTRQRFTASDFVELGIGCESCHGGGLEHAEDPTVHPSYAPTAPFLRQAPGARAPKDSRAQRINRTCARCHQVDFSGYPWSWEGSARNDFTGGSHVNSGEGRDYLLGGCASAMTCVDCHDPHRSDGRARVAALEGDAGDALCTRCHTQYVDTKRRAGHTHHASKSAGDRCIACHMPKKNMNLDGGLGRYHRIGSPNDPTRVERDRPIECAICHADQTVGTLVSTMERWWHRRYDHEKVAALYGGSLDVDPMMATLRYGKPHEEAVAMSLLGERRKIESMEPIAERLRHPIGLLRWYAAGALEKISGRKLPIDLHQDDDAIAVAARAWLDEKK